MFYESDKKLNKLQKNQSRVNIAERDNQYRTQNINSKFEQEQLLPKSCSIMLFARQRFRLEPKGKSRYQVAAFA
jgi:hypothetical protein